MGLRQCNAARMKGLLRSFGEDGLGLANAGVDRVGAPARRPLLVLILENGAVGETFR